jgi:ABC-type multidrug transport system ATPase subunit
MSIPEPLFSLEIRNLRKSFDRPAVDGLDLLVRAGEFYTLLGPNGAGKTTTLRMVVGLLRPDSGDVVVDGLHVPTLGRHELASLRARIGYVFQYGALFDSMTVHENIRMGAYRMRDVLYHDQTPPSCNLQYLIHIAWIAGIVHDNYGFCLGCYL